MLTPRTESTLQWLFEHAIAEVIDPFYSQACQIERVETYLNCVPEEDRRLVSIGISSYLFRLVALFDFAADMATLKHLQHYTGIPDIGGQLLADAYCELANMVGGGVNRELAQSFRHVGMSTPVILETSCARFVDMIKPEIQLGFLVTAAEGMRFHVTVCLASAPRA